MLVTVDEAKLYLRLDSTEEDALIQTLLETAESLCQDIVRTDFDEMEEVPEIVKVGIFYGVTYLYENRENPDKYFSAIVKTRNYYSHYKPDRDGVLSFGQMCNSIDVLKCLIIMILFSHMGMDIDTAKQIMIHDDKLWMYTSCMKKDEDIEG